MIIQIPSITGIILVGGKSRRMGTDKAFLDIAGVPLFERVLRTMSFNFASVLLIGARNERFDGYGLPVIPDQNPGSALGGLYTGLLSADTDLVFVSSCDIPFPSAPLIRYICSLADGFDAVVPRTGNGFEPLFALYRKSCLEPMRRLLDQGNFRIYDFYPEVCVRFVDSGELSMVTVGECSLLNINTPDDYAMSKKTSDLFHANQLTEIGSRQMVSIEEAQRSILEYITPLETEKVSVFQGLNRVTPEDHIAPWDIPPADISAMDGYAFSLSGCSGDRLRVSDFLPAGQIRTIAVPSGEAVKIMTGAPLPPGCDTVVPVEDVAEEGERIHLAKGVREGAHIRRRGEDIRCDTIVIPAGSILRPQEIGMLSAMGKTSLAVYRRTRVAIISTGDELLEPGSTPLPGKIINSNSYSLAAQVLDAGGDPVLLGIAPDTLEATCEKIRAGLNTDILVISGGVSVGDRDFVKASVEALGGKIDFWKVKMKPGKPLAFAIINDKPLFALPGNPVAAMVSFELFVRPALLKSMGHQRIFRPTVKAALQEPLINNGKRPHLVRGIVSFQGDRYCVTTTGNQSSGRLSSLIQGNGLIRIAAEVSLAAGDEVEVILLDRGFEMGGIERSDV